MPRVSDLTEATSMADTDLLYAVIGGNSRRIQRGNVRAVSSVRLQSAITAAGQTELLVSSIPAWANRINLNFVGLRKNGAGNFLIQIGDSGGIEVTGYNVTQFLSGGAAVNTVSHVDGFAITPAAATDVLRGTVTLNRAFGNTWTCGGMVGRTSTSTAFPMGDKALNDPLDRVRVTSASGAELFDLGSLSVSWE